MATEKELGEFFAEAGRILLVLRTTEGTFPTRKFGVEWEHDFGHAKFDGREWDLHLYTPEEQRRIDADRAAVDY